MQDVLRAYLPGDAKAWVFGSRAAWTTKDSSDLDLAIEGEMPFDSRIIGALQDAFEDSDLPYTVDVVDVNRISSSFKQIIEAQKIPLSIPKHFLGTKNRPNRKSEQSAHEQGDAKAGQASDITAEHRKTILTLLKRHLPNTTVWVYGSRAKRTAQSRSDLDLVVFASPRQNNQVSILREMFEESDLPFRVELFVWDDVPESFREQVEAEHAVIAERIRACASNGWLTVTLGDYIELNDSTYSPKEAWPFINYLDTGNITENRITEVRYLTAGTDTIPSRARRKVRPGDIVYSTVRPNQKHFGYLKEVPDNFLASTGFSVIRGKNDIACTNFIYWFLTQDHIVQKLHTIAEHSTSAYPSIRPADIEQLTLHLPPLPEQRAIAHILGTLDDKIELNRRMNKTLEAMARALFKSWFIDFDPVHAKMESRDTGLPEDIGKLFPDRMVDSELSKIPEGWGVYCLDELATHHTKSMTPFSFPETEFEYFSIPAHDNGLMSTVDRGMNIKSNKTIIPWGAVLLSKLNPEILRVWMPDTSNERLQICSTEFLVFTPRDLANRTLLFSLFVDPAFRTMLQSMVTGTSKSHQRVPPTALKRNKVLSGTQALFDKFNELAASMLIHVVRNRTQTHTLASLRDTLLPKLVSGELRVRDVEAFLEV